MTKYLDEWQPNNLRQVSRQVRSDDESLTFLNVRSCAALVVVPAGSKTLTGVHIQVGHGKAKFDKPEDKEAKLAERATILQQLRAAAGPGELDAYIVCAWDFYSHGTLPRDLKKFARFVYLCDVPLPRAVKPRLTCW